MKETAKYKNRFVERIVKLIAMTFNILILNTRCIYRVIKNSSVWRNILVLVTAALFSLFSIIYTDISQKSYN